MEKNEAASLLGKLSVKKNPHLHTREKMVELGQASAKKRKEKKEQAATNPPVHAQN